MKNKIVIFLFSLSFFNCFSQTDTIQLSIHKITTQKKSNNIDFLATTVAESVKKGTHFLYNYPFGGIKGEFLQCAIDTTNLKTAKDSAALIDFAKNYFLPAQKEYFNLIGKSFPDIEGTLLSGERLSISSFLEKPLLLLIFDASNQLSVEVLKDDLRRLQIQYERKGLKFLIISKNSPAEMRHYVEDYNIKIPIMPNAEEAIHLFSKHLTLPYFIFLDKKGKIQHMEVLQRGKQWFEQEQATCGNCYIFHNQESKYNQKQYFYKKLEPVLEAFFKNKN